MKDEIQSQYTKHLQIFCCLGCIVCTLVKNKCICSSVRAADPYNNSLVVIGTSKCLGSLNNFYTEVESGMSSPHVQLGLSTRLRKKRCAFNELLSMRYLCFYYASS